MSKVYHWSVNDMEKCYKMTFIGNDIAGSQYDTATTNWGNPWQMPTLVQCQELIDNTTFVLTTRNSPKGWKFTGSNGESIFIPLTGSYVKDEIIYNYFCGYWSASFQEKYPQGAEILGMAEHYVSAQPSEVAMLRFYGRPVRPVR